MTFDPLKPGGYSTGERLTSAQMNQLNDDIQSALDGAAGGSYDPSAALVIGGAGLETSVTPSSGNDVANKTYVDTALVAALASKLTFGCAYYDLTGSGLAGAAQFTVTEVFSTSGFSLASNNVTVPAAAKYLVSIWGGLTSSGSNNPEYAGAYARRGAGSGVDNVVLAESPRFSTNTAHAVTVAAVGGLDITDTGTQTISFRAETVATVSVSVRLAALVVRIT